jgi:hypothetical protein
MRFGAGSRLASQLRVYFGLNTSARFQYGFGFGWTFIVPGRNQPYFFEC